MSQTEQASTTMTVGQAAKTLHVSASTVKRLIESGELPFREKLDGRLGAYLLDKAVVQRFAKKRADLLRAEADAIDANLKPRVA